MRRYDFRLYQDGDRDDVGVVAGQVVWEIG